MSPARRGQRRHQVELIVASVGDPDGLDHRRVGSTVTYPNLAKPTVDESSGPIPKDLDRILDAAFERHAKVQLGKDRVATTRLTLKSGQRLRPKQKVNTSRAALPCDVVDHGRSPFGVTFLTVEQKLELIDNSQRPRQNHSGRSPMSCDAGHAGAAEHPQPFEQRVHQVIEHGNGEARIALYP